MDNQGHCTCCGSWGPKCDADGSQWNRQQRLIAAGLDAEEAAKATQVRTLSEQVENGIGTVLKAVVNKLEEAHRRLEVADVRLTAQDERLTALEAWRASHAETTEQPKPEPYIPYRDEVYMGDLTTITSDDIEAAKSVGMRWYTGFDQEDFYVMDVNSPKEFIYIQGKPLQVRDLRERPAPAEPTFGTCPHCKTVDAPGTTRVELRGGTHCFTRIHCGKCHEVEVAATWKSKPTAESVPARGWRPCTETPKDGDRVVIDHVGKRWIPIAEVLAAIETAEIPELERRMDERFGSGKWSVVCFCEINTDDGKVLRFGLTQAAAMRAALGDTE